ncbi:amino acid deaminase [Lelliottia wanjuensis]|uniref:Amino acid deaminase n=1 Tax=Lelliottia wanjuensis TaxID=3050585 RepID=A0AAP4D1D9_9ENTR|nr:MULTISPECIES: amino acid deaminase [unclassified Lelliottia]MDK9361915.1 amino acid deaminase [Lelliottia sp. V106_12]MDK9584360.1 amino acid deaminase [Lelliottia sp. V86_10]MDK9617315.1 amino acid deaminase [Lelliottia sp. V106_9]
MNALSRAPHKSAIMSASCDGQPNLLQEDVCLPAAVINTAALDNNIRWMQRYADLRGVSLAPHGKTTMTSWIFRHQQAAGAWAIGTGSIWQAYVALEAGVQRVLIANQLTGRASMLLASQLKAQYPERDLMCCVDSPDNARALSVFFAERGQQMDVLVELGLPDGRCGCRTVEEVLALTRDIAALPGLRLRGLEAYEGVLHGDNLREQTEAFLRDAAALACRMASFVDGEFILTGGGSVWYDVVCNVWLAAGKPERCRVVIRPGCYITLDHGTYQSSQDAIIARDATARQVGGELKPVLELVAMVQSVPQPDMAVANFGKRDAAFDAGLPQAIAHYRLGQALALKTGAVVSTGIMDQHCMLRLASDSDVRVGDILIFGLSHPCLTFDKWKTLLLVDDEYRVQEEVSTAF